MVSKAAEISRRQTEDLLMRDGRNKFIVQETGKGSG